MTDSSLILTPQDVLAATAICRGTLEPALAGDWQIPAGARLGLAGPSGGGKSTLLDLLYGLRPPLDGSLELDETDSRGLRLLDWRSSAALVRVSEVFDGTIAENVKLGADLGSAEIRDCLKMAGLLDEVLSLPGALETRLTTGGRPLSDGQMLRLMIARAVAQKPRLLLIDEVLDRIEDGLECSALVERLLDRNNPWTLVVASTRPEVLSRCDAVFHLVNGKLECLPKVETTSLNSNRFA